jgi:hypothetical protein
VSHFHVFGCKSFILKKGKKLVKFEARSVDGIFFDYASHSRAYRVLNLETNQIVETCEVTFGETQSCSHLVFECTSDDELGEEIFQEEEHEHGDDEDGGVVPRLNMYILLRLWWWTDPLLHLRRQIKIEEKLLLRGEVALRREPPR